MRVGSLRGAWKLRLPRLSALLIPATLIATLFTPAVAANAAAGLNLKIWNSTAANVASYSGGTLCSTSVAADINASGNWSGLTDGSPCQADYFYAQYTGFIQAPATGTFTFKAKSDDGFRLLVNNTLLIEDWEPQGPATYNSDNATTFQTIDLVAGQYYPVEVQYYEYGGGQEVALYWEYPGQGIQLVPGSAYSTGVTVNYDANGGTGAGPSNQTKEYGTDLTLSGSPGGFVREGYSFAGWNTSADGAGTSYSPGATYSTNAAATLYAVWEPEVDYALDLGNAAVYMATPDNFLGTNTPSALSVAMWMRYDDSAPVSNDTVFRIGYNSATRATMYIDDGVLVFAPFASSATALPFSPEPGAWHHYAMVYDESAAAGSIYRIYVDGIELGAFAAADISFSTSADNRRIFFGGYTQGTIRGLFDEIKIFDDALSSSEVQSVMHGFGDGSGTSAAGYDDANLVAYYSFNNQSEMDVDTTGGAHNLTVFGSPTYQAIATSTSVNSGEEVLVTFPRSYITSLGGWSSPANTSSATLLAVGGGGAGGSNNYGASGGGGGGRVLESSVTLSSGAVHAVLVGQGGVPSPLTAVPTVSTGSDGQSSEFGVLGQSPVTSLGGGAGANSRLYSQGEPNPSTSGWTGGGGSAHASASSSGSTGVGGANLAGGDGNPSGTGQYQAGGGGGGASGSGTDGSNGVGGDGGSGAAATLTGQTYGGGGGGGLRYSSGTRPGNGGAGGGGAGGTDVAAPESGSANTGGGGGGTGEGSYKTGGFGGSGFVAIQYVVPTIPDTVTNLSVARRLIDADSDADSVDLTWTAVSGHVPPVTGYSIEWDTNPSFTTGNTPVQVLGEATATATVSGLTDGANYYFRISALNAEGAGSASASVYSEPVSAEDFALDFDNSVSNPATSTFASSADGTQVIPSDGNFTVEAWFNPDAFAQRDFDDYYTIVSQDQDSWGNTHPRFMMALVEVNDTGLFTIHVASRSNSGSDVAFEQEYSHAIRAGEWSHIAVTSDSASQLWKVYLNGVLIYTSPANQYLSGVGSSLAGFHIGSTGYRDASNQQLHFFNGQIDQVKVWDAALSTTQLVESMHSWGSADVTSAPPLLANYDFNDFTNASTLKDQAGSFDLTLNNAAVSDLKPLVDIDTSDPAVVTYDFKRSYLTELGGWTVPTAPAKFNALVVGGGGGGAGNKSSDTRSSSGSGGGGGVYNTRGLTLSGVLPVTVGLGGLGGISSATQSANTGYQGQSSSLSTLSAGGGGAGGCSTVSSNNVPCTSSDRIHGLPGTASGSGGSASNYWNAYNYGNAGTATSATLGGQTLAAVSGFAGGVYVQGSSVSYSSGSAGGAGGAGTYNAPGPGVAATIPGISGTFGTGGASWNAAAWTGAAPAANTGAGGSGAYNTTTATPGFSGSSGRVVLSYLIPSQNVLFNYNSTDTNSYDFAVDGSVTDLSGNGINATAMNSIGLDATTHAWSLTGGAQASTPYIDVDDIATSLLREQGFTVDFEADFGGVNQGERIFDFAESAGNTNDSILVFRQGTTNDLEVHLRVGSSSAHVCEAPNALLNQTGLHRYTISLDGSTCKMYRNGTEILSTAFPYLPTEGITYTSNYIGRSHWAEDNFTGQIRYIRFFKGAFTPSEIGAVSYKTVTLDASPGTITDASLITSGSVRLPEPTRSQYTNEGWYTDLADSSTKKTSPFTPSADVTLLANWELSEYVVTWDSNGGSSLASSTIVAGNSIAKPTDPTRTGYRFEGWSTSETSDQGDLGNKITSWPHSPGSASAVTLYAIWYQESSLTLAGTGPAGAKTSTANLIPMDSSYTWEAWIKPSTLPGTGQRYGTVLDNIEAGNNYGRSWIYIMDSGSGPYLSAGYWTETQKGGGFASAAGTITYDSWNHVAVTYERTGSAEGNCSSVDTLITKLYINGELAATPSTVNSFSGCLNNDELGVGYNIDDNAQQFPGQIDQVKIWSGVLTESEIQNSMKSYQLGTVDNSMIAHFDFNQLSSNPVYGDTVPNRAATGSGYDLSLFANTQSFVDSYVTRTANQFTVAFDDNSATSGSVASVPNLMPYDSLSIPSSGTLQRTAHTFSSWNTKADGSGTSYSPGDSFLSLYGDTTLYASWTANTYTVTYNYSGADGGTRPVDSTYDLSSQQAIALPTPTKTGLLFGGWYSDAGLTSRVGDAGASYTPTADVTLYARWTNLLINLDGSNGDSLANSGTTWTSIDPGASSAVGTAVGDATYFGSDGNPEGFTLDGSGDAIQFPLGAQDISGEITLETWINPSQLRLGWNLIASNWFDAAGVSSSGNFDFHFAIKRDPVDNKYKLNLYTSTNGTSYQLSDQYGDFSFGLNQWYLVGFTINSSNELQFYINGEADGSPVPNVQHTARSSYLYLGDFRSYGFIGNIGEFRTYNKALSAGEMESSFTSRAAFYGYSAIDFQAGDNGSGTTVTNYKFDGDSLTLPDSSSANSMFTRTNFVVSGWSINSDGSTTDYALGATYSTDADLTLYPVWQPNTKEIIFNANDGSGTPATTSQTVNYSTATALTANSFSRIGYTFSGWNTQADGLGTDYADQAVVTLTADLTLYAEWAPLGNRFANLTSGNPGSGGTSGEAFKYTSGALLPADRSNFTVEVWFKEKSGSYVYSGQNPIVTQGVDGNSEFTIMASGQGSARQLYVVSGGTWATTGIALDLDRWYHLAYTFDDGTYSVYLDGVLADTGTLPEGANVGNFYLGENAYYAAGTALQRHVFHGYLDQLKIWSKALTLTEVQTSMHAWGDAGISNLIHHYSFDDVASPGKDEVGSSDLSLSGVGSGSTAVTYGNFDLAIRTPSSGLAGDVGTTYSLPAFAPGGDGVKTFSISSGTLPAGLSLNSANGLISGTPTVAGDQSVILTVTDEASGTQSTSAFTVSVSALLTNVGAPTVAATSQTLKSIDVSWTAVSNASSYTLKIYNSAGTTLLDTISLANSLTSYTVTSAAGSFETIADGTNYQLSMTAVGTGNYVTSDESAKSSVTTLASFAVTYSANGSTSGTTPASQVKVEGVSLQLATNSGTLARTGYTFAGWNTQADGEGTDYAAGASYATDANLALFAKWSPDTFTITYSYNGADGGTQPATDSYTNGGTAVTLPTPSKTGYTFGGWYDNSGLTGSAVTSPYSPSSDVTLYAKWTGQTYTVNFSYFGADGGDSQSSGTFTVGSGSPITLPTPTKTGYTFAGWYSGSFATLVGAGGASYSPTQNLTLSAKWTAIQYNVTYNSDIVVSGITYSGSGDVPVDANTYTIGSTVPVLPNAQATPVTRLGYTFVGWVTNQDGTGTALNSGESLSMGSVDVNLYPKWSANTYTVTYNLNGGTGSLTGAPTSYTVGGNNVPLPSSGFTKTGFDFIGWTKTQGGTTAISNSFSTFADVTLYAIWQLKTVNYTFDDGIADKATLGITWPSDSSASFGSSITLPDLSGTLASVGADQYLFFGWSLSGADYAPGASYTMGESTAAFVAEWVMVRDVRYSFNGGTHSGSGNQDAVCLANNPQVCTVGQNISLRSNPSRAGYDFLGWKVQDKVTVKPGGASHIVADDEYLFYAQWQAIDYTISFNSVGGSNNFADATKNIGEVLTLPNPGAKPHHSFAGWTNDSGVTLLSPNATFVVGASSEAFEAVWTPDQYRIVYNWQGAVGTPEADGHYTFGSGDMTLPAQGDRIRDGFNFAGWSTSPSGAIVSGFQPTADTVLYAQWSNGNYSLTFVPKGGAMASTSASVPRGSSVQLPTPTRVGFVFTGWYDAATNGNKIGAGGAQVSISASGSLYAGWVQRSLYGVDEASLESSQIYTASSSSAIDTTLTHGPSSSSARVQIPAGSLTAGTKIDVRFFRDNQRQQSLINNQNSYVLSVMVSWLYGTGDSATVPDTDPNKPITVTLTNSQIKEGSMIYKVIGDQITELGRAQSDGVVTVELFEDPEIVIAITAPDAPQSVTAVAGDQKATVSWSAPASDGGDSITGYTVTANTGETCTWTSGPLTCEVTGLANGTNYTFSVVATNSIGSSSAATATATPVAPSSGASSASPTPSTPGPAASIDAVSDQSWVWTKRISKNEVKVYIKFPEMGANYQINLQKNDGEYSRKMSKTINTTADTDLRVVGEWYYLVRTITLPGEGRYRIEVTQDGQRVTLNGQDRPAVYSYR